MSINVPSGPATAVGATCVVVGGVAMGFGARDLNRAWQATKFESLPKAVPTLKMLHEAAASGTAGLTHAQEHIAEQHIPGRSVWGNIPVVNDVLNTADRAVSGAELAAHA